MISIQPLPADFDDWETLLSLILTAFAYMDGVIDPPSSAHHLTPQSLQQKASDEVCYLAQDGHEIVGCIFMRPEPAGYLYIGKLAVSPGAQGRGIGRKLLLAAEHQARQRGLPALRLETRIELTANHATFMAWGFAKTAEKSHTGYSRTTFIEMRKILE
ncbi:GNAT family N-acetyltransferase [Rhizobium sp. FY34]|uniref:GNAT family N-acetyltransferase n=1 Tax=Rhizobium sp. FY34 TaxID=2562309 RepID=UPI0010BFBB30|nr:GNAT family N-acetyltransferase [Rhizobium sp. FY34]